MWAGLHLIFVNGFERVILIFSGKNQRYQRQPSKLVSRLESRNRLWIVATTPVFSEIVCLFFYQNGLLFVKTGKKSGLCQQIEKMLNVKNKLIFGAVSSIFAIGLLHFSCKSEYVQPVEPVCFESEVLPIFQANCTQSGCHNAFDKEKGYDLSSYNGIVEDGIEPGDYRKSKMYQVLVKLGGEEAMPPKPYERLSDDQITTIALWIEEGANNTTGCLSTSCDTLSAQTFSGSVFPILQLNCNGCHGGSAPQGDVDLTTWAKVKPYATSGSLVGSISHEDGWSEMPKSANKMSDCNIAKIRKWVEAGALNN